MTQSRHKLKASRWSRSNRYDHLDRRVQKITSAATSNSSTPNSSTRQLYIPFYDAYGNVVIEKWSDFSVEDSLYMIRLPAAP